MGHPVGILYFHTLLGTYGLDIRTTEELLVIGLHVGQDVAERRVLRIFCGGQDELLSFAILFG